ncbi:MAG: hypothetical protein LLG04_14410 [Parachlamydia sp.]|nr:hypothetical protein [Parachlamydia sp.]
MTAIAATNHVNQNRKIVETTLTEKRALLKKEESTIDKLRIAELAIQIFGAVLALASIPIVCN